MVNDKRPHSTDWKKEKILNSKFRKLLHGLKRNKDIYIAAVATIIIALALIFVQKSMLSDIEFVTISIVFASSSFIAVISQMGDDADVLETHGNDLARSAIGWVLLRILFISIIASLLFYAFNGVIRNFGLFQFLIFTTLFSLSNWSYNLRRNQALMRHDNVDFRNASLICATIRLGCFAGLVPFIGQYAILSEVVSRIFLLPTTSKRISDVVKIIPFSKRKLIRSSSYSTDALVQTQTLTAVSMVSTSDAAATIILIIRLLFYGTGALSQIVGTIFNRSIFQRRNISFPLFFIPGFAFVVLLLVILWLCHIMEKFDDYTAIGAMSVVLALATFPVLHPLSRLFTATNREWIKLCLQVVYCILVVWIAASFNSIWPPISIAAVFSICYAVSFTYVAKLYQNRKITRLKFN